jgi:acyl-CoA reductase-like NAD-dependent aldehyde dehydrogenase
MSDHDSKPSDPSAPASRELPFGGVWNYAPSKEGTDHFRVEKRYGCFIGGEFRAPKSGEHFATINPATEETICEVAQGSQQDVDAAVAAAKKALPAWRKLSGEARGRYMFRIARIIQERARELACLETMDGGKPIRESRDVDVPLAAGEVVDAVEIDWPGAGSGPLATLPRTEVISGVEPGQVVTIRQGEGVIAARPYARLNLEALHAEHDDAPTP